MTCWTSQNLSGSKNYNKTLCQKRMKELQYKL